MKQKGFTLIEVLISIVIFVTILIAFLTVMPQTQLETEKAERIFTLQHLAQQKIEQLRGLNYSSPELTAGWHPETGAQFVRMQEGFPSDYSVRWYVEENQPAPKMKTVTVEVGYRVYQYPQGSENRSADRILVTLKTFLVDTGEIFPPSDGQGDTGGVGGEQEQEQEKGGTRREPY